MSLPVARRLHKLSSPDYSHHNDSPYLYESRRHFRTQIIIFTWFKDGHRDFIHKFNLNVKNPARLRVLSKYWQDQKLACSLKIFFQENMNRRSKIGFHLVVPFRALVLTGTCMHAREPFRSRCLCKTNKANMAQPGVYLLAERKQTLTLSF